MTGTVQTIAGLENAAASPAGMDADASAAVDGLPACSGERIGFAGLAASSALVRSWKRLEAAACLPTQSYAFSVALSHTLLADACAEVALIRCAGEIAALLPLCRGRGYFDRWRMMGAREVFEPGDALCDSPESARMLAELIAQGGRSLSLDRIPAGSPIIAALQDAMKGKGRVLVRPAVPCPTIALDEGWKDPESRFSSRRRSDFRRAARRAEEFGAVSFEVLAPRPDEFDAMFDEAIGVELCSWKREAGTAIAADRDKEEFFRQYFRLTCEQGSLRIAFMRIDGQPAAMQIALECLDRFWLFKIGYDERFGKCSPGTLLMLHTLRWAAERDLRAYELLGNAESWIADFWTKEHHDFVRLRTYPFTIRGGFAFAADATAWLRSRLAKALK